MWSLNQLDKVHDPIPWVQDSNAPETVSDGLAWNLHSATNPGDFYYILIFKLI